MNDNSKTNKRVAILDGTGKELSGLQSAFQKECGENGVVESFTSGAELLDRVRSDEPPDLVVVDYFLGDGDRDGLAVLSAVRVLDPHLPVVVVAEKGDVDIATRAVKAGATDFLVRGGRLSERVSTQLRKIRTLLDLIEKTRRLDRHTKLLAEEVSAKNRIVGSSPAMLEVVKKIVRVARVPRPVLITGERGTGKELVARAIHEAGGSLERPFVVVNCAAFTDTLLESELFGHERGAFTGADDKRAGKFEQADGGALFLDEIGNMSLPFQQKVLRVVEYGTFNRVGGTKEIKVNTRVIAATNADLEQLMKEKKFLRDLYDRLAFEVIEVPPLREREGDVEILAAHFLDTFMREVPAFQGKRLSKQALARLGRYSFPGNVRELKNLIERAVYRDTTNELSPEDIGLLAEVSIQEQGGGFKERVEALERSLIKDALEKSGNNQAGAARKLGLTYHQFRYYYRKYITSVK